METLSFTSIITHRWQKYTPENIFLLEEEKKKPYEEEEKQKKTLSLKSIKSNKTPFLNYVINVAMYINTENKTHEKEQVHLVQSCKAVLVYVFIPYMPTQAHYTSLFPTWQDQTFL